MQCNELVAPTAQEQFHFPFSFHSELASLFITAHCIDAVIGNNNGMAMAVIMMTMEIETVEKMMTMIRI